MSAVAKSTSRSRGSNVFTWLDKVRERRQMFARTLDDLESQIWGYYTALDNHHIVEPFPSMRHHFLIWVHYRTGWSTSGGWAGAIAMHVSEPEKQFAKFFRLVDEYRQLVPTVLCTARLRKHHDPTGRRVVYGMDGRIEKPKRVDIFRYVPQPLHFLRFHYPDRITDDWLLMKTDGSYHTSVRDAKRWVRDELQIKDDEWHRAGSRSDAIELT
jgi:hypothetical protein